MSILIILTSGIAVAIPNTDEKTSCHIINAKGIGQDLGSGRTQADIIGGGLLHGTTEGNFVITGFVGTVASFTGTVVFTTNHGTLTVTVTGIFDISNGKFDATGSVTDSTGKLDGATGTINLQGVEDLTNGSFVEDVTGRICLDLSQDKEKY